jgi:hypothetical protein
MCTQLSETLNVLPKNILYFYGSSCEKFTQGRCGCMVDGFTTTCAIGAYLQLSYEFESFLWQGVLNTTLQDNKVCQ